VKERQSRYTADPKIMLDLIYSYFVPENFFHRDSKMVQGINPYH
jgi:hypothetical protein